MVEWIILAGTILCLIGVHVWPRVMWGSEDWRHLEIRDWDETASRGRIKSWRVE